MRIGYLAQGSALTRHRLSAKQSALLGSADVAERRTGTRGDLAQSAPPPDAALNNTDMLLQRLLHQVTAGQQAYWLLELDTIDPDLPVAVLSGGRKHGWRSRLILLEEPQLLLLDEPTNHLDIAMPEWLGTMARKRLSGRRVDHLRHDRTFLDER